MNTVALTIIIINIKPKDAIWNFMLLMTQTNKKTMPNENVVLQWKLYWSTCLKRKIIRTCQVKQHRKGEAMIVILW